MIGDEESGIIATFRKVSPLDYVRGPKKEKTPEEEAEEAAQRIIKEIKRLEREREKDEKDKGNQKK
jgi:hypothetical protein